MSKVCYDYHKRTCNELTSIGSGKTSNAGADVPFVAAADDASRCCSSSSSCFFSSPCPLVPWSPLTEKLNLNETPPSSFLRASPGASAPPNIGERARRGRKGERKKEKARVSSKYFFSRASETKPPLLHSDKALATARLCPFSLDYSEEKSREISYLTRVARGLHLKRERREERALAFFFFPSIQRRRHQHFSTSGRRRSIPRPRSSPRQRLLSLLNLTILI